MSAITNTVKESGDAVPLTSVPVVFSSEGHITRILEMGSLTENSQLVDTSYETESDALPSSSVNITQSREFPILFQTSSECHINMMHTMTDAKPEITLLQPVHEAKIDLTSSPLIPSISSPLMLSKEEMSVKKGVLTATDVPSEPESSKSVTPLQSSLELQDVNRTLGDHVPVVLSGTNLALIESLDRKSLNEVAVKVGDGSSLSTSVSPTSMSLLKTENGASTIPMVLSETGDGFDMETAGAEKADMSPTSIFPEGAVLVETPQGLMLSVGNELRAVTLTEGPDAQGNHLLSISNNCIPVALLSQGGLLEEGGVVYQGSGEGEVGAEGPVVSSSELSLGTQQVLTVSTPEDVEPKRKIRGWPKGKKRKPAPEISGPRAPMTGYVLFAINRRQEIKQSHPNLPFTEVTKILGQEWSSMPQDKKEKFLAEAENDKQRYIDELKQFQKSDVYQKKRRENGDCGKDIDDDDEAEDDSDELHCRVCKVYFSSLHNKKEHLLGKQHLQAITDQLKKDMKKQQKEQEGELRDPLAGIEMGDQGDNSGLFLSEPGDMSNNRRCSCWAKPVNVSDAISDFVHRVFERDQEIFKLRRVLRKHSQEKYSICTQFQELKDYESKLQQELKDLTAHTSLLTDRINTLKMVPALFGVGEIS